MTIVRVVLLATGLLAAGYGVALLSDNPPVIILRIVIWAVAAVVIHDAVVAPICVVMGFAGRRALPRRWWSPVAVAGLCSLVLVLLAVPVFDKPGMHPDNMSVLDRDYHQGLLLALAVVWAAVPAYLLMTRVLPVRQDQMVERQRAQDVESQPPPA